MAVAEIPVSWYSIVFEGASMPSERPPTPLLAYLRMLISQVKFYRRAWSSLQQNFWE
jgi:hypothetical protein